MKVKTNDSDTEGCFEICYQEPLFKIKGKGVNFNMVLHAYAGSSELTITSWFIQGGGAIFFFVRTLPPTMYQDSRIMYLCNQDFLCLIYEWPEVRGSSFFYFNFNLLVSRYKF